MRRTAAVTGALLITAAMLTACGGSDDSDDSSAATSTAAAGETAPEPEETSSGSSGGATSVTSAADVAEAIGCSTSSPYSTEELFVTDAAKCDIHSEEVTAYYFSTNDARDSYLEIAGQFGGQYLVGENFLVEATPAGLKALQEEVGGEIKPC